VHQLTTPTINFFAGVRATLNEAPLERPPVVARRPVAGECLDRVETHALRRVDLAVTASR